MLRVGKAISLRMSELDSTNQGYYRSRLVEWEKKLSATAKAEALRFRALSKQKRQVVAYHQSFPYLLDWLGLEQIETIEPKPGIQPSPGHVAYVLKRMRSTKTQVIVQEDYYPRNATDTLAQLADAAVVVIPGGTRVKEGEDYSGRIKRMTEALYAALSK